MANIIEAVVKRVVRSTLSGGRGSVTKSVIENNMMSGSQSASGTVTGVNEQRASVNIIKSSGEPTEFFFQNRYVQRGDSVAAIGHRAL